MKISRKSLTATALTVVLVSITTSLRAEEDDHAESPSTQPAHVSLEHEMEAMGHLFKTIRNQVADPSQNESTIAAVIELEQHTLAAKSAAPRSATTMPTTMANAEKLEDYHALMLNLLRQELDLEELLSASKNDKAAEVVNSMRGLENEGHKEFRRRRNG